MAQNNENERLQQAAEEYVDKYYSKLGTTQTEHSVDAKISKEDFIAGAQWQKGQYMDDIKSAEDHAYFAVAEATREKLINKACEYLRHSYEDIGIRYTRGANVEEEIEEFKRNMED